MGKNKGSRPKQHPAAAIRPRRSSPIVSVLLLGVILVAAFLIRALSGTYSPESLRGGLGMFGDSYLYHVIAYNLYKGNGYSGVDDGAALGQNTPTQGTVFAPAIVRAPLYPAFLAGAYTVLGSGEALPSANAWRATFDRVRLLQCALDAFVCLLVFLITRAVIPEPIWPALVAATLYALCPFSVFYSRAFLTETLASFLVAASTLLTILSLRRERPGWWFAAGVGWGLVALCRPEYLPFGAVVAGFMFLAHWRQWRVACKSMIVVAIGAALVVSPWILRNQAVFDRPALTVGGLGYGLYLGTFETNTNWLGWNQYPEGIFADAREAEEVRALDRDYTAALKTGDMSIKPIDDRFLTLALDRIRRDPWAAVQTWATRIPRLWYAFYIPMYRINEPSGVYVLFYFALALYGFARASRDERRLMAPMGLLCLYVTLLYLPLHIEPRYSVPCMPGLVCLCAIGIWKAWCWGRQRLGA